MKNGVEEMLLYAIERKRSQMILLAEKYGYTSEATVKCSQELDKLLNLAQQNTCMNVKMAK
ncbi:aspartyl-phosphate phosphatase Spo0E family protein [Alkalihalobacterium sp. APHAB7]